MVTLTHRMRAYVPSRRPAGAGRRAPAVGSAELDLGSRWSPVAYSATSVLSKKGLDILHGIAARGVGLTSMGGVRISARPNSMMGRVSPKLGRNDAVLAHRPASLTYVSSPNQRSPRDMPAGSCRVDQQWREPLHPPVEVT